MARLSATEKANKERKNPAEEDPEFQIAPMIDILLVLMIFFMTISSTEVLQSNRDLVLPVAKDGKTSKKNEGQVIVNVLWAEMNNSGMVEIDSAKYQNPNEIIPRLNSAFQANPMVRVLVRADRGVRYDYLKGILKAVGMAGIGNITFSVVDKEAAPK